LWGKRLSRWRWPVSSGQRPRPRTRGSVPAVLASRGWHSATPRWCTGSASPRMAALPADGYRPSTTRFMERAASGLSSGAPVRASSPAGPLEVPATAAPEDLSAPDARIAPFRSIIPSIRRRQPAIRLTAPLAWPWHEHGVTESFLDDDRRTMVAGPGGRDSCGRRSRAAALPRRGALPGVALRRASQRSGRTHRSPGRRDPVLLRLRHPAALHDATPAHLGCLPQAMGALDEPGV